MSNGGATVLALLFVAYFSFFSRTPFIFFFFGIIAYVDDRFRVYDFFEIFIVCSNFLIFFIILEKFL